MIKTAFRFAVISGLVTATTLATAADGAPSKKVVTTEKGPVLADARGLTLYTFDKDYEGQSNCTGPCATNWPPLAASEKDIPRDGWTIIVRGDGSRQWALRGKPVYTWIKDTKPGEATGDGAFGLWHVIKP